MPAVEPDLLDSFTPDLLGALAATNCDLVAVNTGDIEATYSALVSISEPLSDRQVGTLLVASINNYCRQWADELVAWLGSPADS